MTAVGTMNHSQIRRRSASNANDAERQAGQHRVGMGDAEHTDHQTGTEEASPRPRGREASSTIIAAKPAHRPINVLRCAYSEAEIVLSTHR